MEVRGFVAENRPTQSGLMVGDKILKVNDAAVENVTDILSVIKPLRVGDEVRLQVTRDERQQSIKMRLPEWPREAPVGFEVLYNEVKTESKTLRCLVTRPPQAAHGRVPAVFYIQGIVICFTQSATFPGSELVAVDQPDKGKVG